MFGDFLIACPHDFRRHRIVHMPDVGATLQRPERHVGARSRSQADGHQCRAVGRRVERGQKRVAVHRVDDDVVALTGFRAQRLGVVALTELQGPVRPQFGDLFSLSGLRQAPTTHPAPSSLAAWTAMRPTTPVAPNISTVSPCSTLACRVSGRAGRQPGDAEGDRQIVVQTVGHRKGRRRVDAASLSPRAIWLGR